MVRVRSLWFFVVVLQALHSTHGAKMQSVGWIRSQEPRHFLVSVSVPWQGSPPHMFAWAMARVLMQSPLHRAVSFFHGAHSLNWQG